ncbi:VWA domain-containing protein [Aureimonas sp. AU22]|uniref:vWA domain-containing protein n=1 Tax=Aureimonas sp. AU22 TaxID=1638162 RepID=UPI001FCCF124|nr:VWA domain-containing protein [Aureimonas sp. AU22]
MKAVTGGRLDLERWPVQAFSEVVVANRSIELALVLDNSGSMERAPAGGGAAKITTLRDATKKLVEEMLKSQPQANAKDPVRISVVPFAASVNIGKDYANADWMDTKGINPSHHDDLDWSKLAGAKQAADGSWRLSNAPLTKFTIFEKLRQRRSDWGWGGCVQSRPEGFAITDDTPDTRYPSTLFVPMFAPSEYDWSGTLSSVKNDYLPDASKPSNSADATALAKQRDVTKYFGTGAMDTRKGGPNSGCTTSAITPLTATQSTVQSAVRDMQPLGGTNIAEGLAWGWRTLTSGQPFPEGRARGTKENLKVVVLMTDGENTYNAAYTSGEQIELTNANRSQFGTYGYGQFLQTAPKQEKVRTGRMFEATKATTPKAAITNITAAMNETMSLTCENIKKDGTNDEGGDGVVIFAIAFDLKDGSPIKDRLRACASNGIDGKSAKLYYDAKNSSDLLTAFSSITDEISALRIAR